MLAKILLLLILVAIVVTLGSAHYLVRDVGASERTVRTFTWRTLLSIFLFLLLLLAFHFGLIKPYVAGFGLPSTTSTHHQ